MEVARLGPPAGLIGPTAFQGLAVSELAALGIAGLPLLVVQHPLGGERPESVARKAREAVEQLAGLIGGATTGESGRVGAPRTSLGPPSEQADPADLATMDDDPQAVLAAFCERGWCDGLPVVPPTEGRVRAMLGGAPPEPSLGAVPPLWRQAAPEKPALHTVLAGPGTAPFPAVPGPRPASREAPV